VSTPRITWSDVVAIAPELSTFPLGGQAPILAYVNEGFLRADMFGAGQLRLAQLNLAAHIATLEKRRGGVGPLTAESMGGVSRSYANTLLPSLFATTSYGVVYQLMLKTSLARLPMVI
jgi:hypothetical protein